MKQFSKTIMCFLLCAGLVVLFTSPINATPSGPCQVLVDDNFESYTLDLIGSQADHWNTWSMMPGGSEDAPVTDAIANSGSNSLVIQDGNDVVLLLGNQTQGNWAISFNMNIFTNSNGYFNIQHHDDFGNYNNAMNVGLHQGVGFINIGPYNGVNEGEFDYVDDQWMKILLFIDIDNDEAKFLVDGVLIYRWTFSTSSNTTALNQLGAVDFFGWNNHLFFIDDVYVGQLEACPENTVLCEKFDSYDPGVNNAAHNASWLKSRNNAPGSSDDADISNEQSASCDRSLKVTSTDPDNFLILLGDSTSGNYSLEWDYYIPAGSDGYWNIQKFQNDPGGEIGSQVLLFDGGNAELDAGSSNVASFSFPQNQWFKVQMFYDLDNNWVRLIVDGTEVYEWPSIWQSVNMSGINQLGAVNFVGNTNVTQYVDNIILQSLPPVTDIDEVAFEAGIRLYPNLATTYTTLEYNFPEVVELTIEVINSIGQVVLKTMEQEVMTGTLQLDLSNLANGIYFVNTRAGVNQLTERLIVQKP